MTTMNVNNHAHYVGIFIGNGYLSGTQHGIQAGHVVAKLFPKYDSIMKHPEEKMILFQWANEPEKWILDGGHQEHTLAQVLAILTRVSKHIDLPFADFIESKSAIAGIRTSVGFVVDINRFNKEELVDRKMTPRDVLNDLDNLKQQKKKLTTQQCYSILHWLAYKFKRA